YLRWHDTTVGPRHVRLLPGVHVPAVQAPHNSYCVHAVLCAWRRLLVEPLPEWQLAPQTVSAIRGSTHRYPPIPALALRTRYEEPAAPWLPSVGYVGLFPLRFRALHARMELQAGASPPRLHLKSPPRGSRARLSALAYHFQSSISAKLWRLAGLLAHPRSCSQPRENSAACDRGSLDQSWTAIPSRKRQGGLAILNLWLK